MLRGFKIVLANCVMTPATWAPDQSGEVDMEHLRDETKPVGQAMRRPGRAFARSEDGSLIIFGLMMFVLILTVGGMAVDFMRFEAQRTRLQSTLDRAVLAAASLDQPLDAKDVVLDYFQKAGLGSFIDSDDITVVETDFSRRVEATVGMKVNSTFLQLVGISDLIAPGSGGAEEAASLTEISMVVDVSGSMSWPSATGNSRIEELRRAARKFVNIVLCDPTNPDSTTNCTVEPGTVSVSLVPYAEQVLVGETILDSYNVTEEHSYSSCVHFEEADYSTTAISTTDQIQRMGHFDPWSTEVGDPAGGYYDNNWACETDSWRKITPLNGNIATLHGRINALGASGNTSIDTGMKWGAALLDPAFRDVTEDLNDNGKIVADIYRDRPYDWTKRGLEKVIVLMTDGENREEHFLYDDHRSGPSPVFRNIKSDGTLGNRYSIYDAPNDRYWWTHTNSWEDHAYGTGTIEQCGWVGWWWWAQWQCTTVPEGNGAEQLDFVDLWNSKPWVWYEQFSWFLPSPGSLVGTAAKNTRLQNLCNAAKNSGITIFAIGYEAPPGSASRTTMQNCASSPAHYFDATGLNIAAAFSAIAREITKLRLIN